jgi:hypothetical protein
MRLRTLTSPYAIRAPLPGPHLEVDLTRGPLPLACCGEMPHGGSITVTVAHDFAGDENDLQKTIAEQFASRGAPLRVTIERVTLTSKERP